MKRPKINHLVIPEIREQRALWGRQLRGLRDDIAARSGCKVATVNAWFCCATPALHVGEVVAAMLVEYGYQPAPPN